MEKLPFHTNHFLLAVGVYGFGRRDNDREVNDVSGSCVSILLRQC